MFACHRCFPRLLPLLAACTPMAGPSDTGEPRVYEIDVGPPRSYRLGVGDTIPLRAVAKALGDCDAEFGCQRKVLSHPVTWASSNPAVVSVSSGSGLSGRAELRALSRGDARVTVRAGSVSVTIAVEVRTRIPLVAISSGGHCGLSAAGELFCWGGLGDSAQVLDPDYLAPRLVPGGSAGASVATRERHGCIASAGHATRCWGRLPLSPTAFSGSAFTMLSAGDPRSQPTFSGFAHQFHGCGLDTDGAAWCWGYDDHGQLGSASTAGRCDGVPCSYEPLAVASASRFQSISAGGTHTCGLTPDGAVWCWGDNAWGQLGDGSTVSRRTPAPVEDLPPVGTLTAGRDHTCAVTRSGAALCWGRNQNGQLGGPGIDRQAHPRPEEAPGAPALVTLDALDLTCGLTAAGEAWCWGGGIPGPTGAGARRFSSLGVGTLTVGSPGDGWFASEQVDERACAAATDGRTFCWGRSLQPYALHGPAR